MATLVPPPVPPAAIPRAVPQTTVEKWNAWRFWSSYWSWAYILTGSLLSLVSTVVAANTKTQFLGGRASITIACAAAVLTFVVNALGAQSKAAAFETAGRELEKVIAGHRRATRNRYSQSTEAVVIHARRFCRT
jgi:hypothetical protein